ncbi:uncharacterized protein V1516DRAFT_696284 [Lipomyces oligophaga]|uniref:uncharacterized protein n=1 Tax=Lipomyces oligophaga TaxID=45792 RepID=UPI0034CD08F5
MWSLSSLFTAFSVVFWVLNYKNIPLTPSEEVGNVFRVRTYTTRSPAMECDLNGHKSNSTYFSDLDIARTDLMVDVFRKLILDLKKRDGRWVYIPLGAVASVFRREIKPYASYNIRSKIVGWDDKWLFVVSKFESPQTKKLHAISVTKYVFKMGRKTLPIREALERNGTWSPEIERQGREGMKWVQGIVDLDQIEEMPF